MGLGGAKLWWCLLLLLLLLFLSSMLAINRAEATLEPPDDAESPLGVIADTATMSAMGFLKNKDRSCVPAVADADADADVPVAGLGGTVVAATGLGGTDVVDAVVPVAGLGGTDVVAGGTR